MMQLCLLSSLSRPRVRSDVTQESCAAHFLDKIGEIDSINDMDAKLVLSPSIELGFLTMSSLALYRMYHMLVAQIRSHRYLQNNLKSRTITF